MTIPPLDLSTGDIARHTPWMRRLARGLLGDPAAADDVVQDVWAKLAFASRRPGYLAAVVRSLAHRRHREERRRSWREQGVARSEALPSAAEVAERAELARVLAEAVADLEEPYRTTIVLRYYEGLSSAEIARRSGTPAVTVRTRLKRGLDLLRTRLDERHGGRAQWVGVLVPLAQAETETASSLAVAATTVLTVKLAIAGALALCVIALTWRLVSNHAAREAALVTLAAQEPDPSDAAAPRAEHPLGVSSARAEAVAESAGLAATTPATAPRAIRVHARAVDDSGAAVRDAWLRFSQAPDDAAQGDRDGHLSMSLAPGALERLQLAGDQRTVEVEVGAKWHRRRYLRPYLGEGAHDLELGDVELAPGGAVHGRVVDEAGLGVVGALVAAGMPSDAAPGDLDTSLGGPPDLDIDAWSGRAPALIGSSGAGGEFRLDGLPVGYATVWARTTTSLWAFSAPVGVRAGEEVSGIELVVREAPERVLAGRVLDPDGGPLGGVELTFSTSDSDDGWWSVRADARGAFWFAPQDGAAQDVTVRSPSSEWDDVKRAGVAPGTQDLVIAFERSQWLAIHAQAANGALVRHGRAVGLPESGPTDRALLRCDAPLDEQGRARLRRPDAPLLRVRVEAYGYRDRIVGPFETANFPDPLLVTLEPVPALIGQVRHADGSPAAGARVSLHLGVGGSGSVTPPGGAGAAPRHLTHQGWAGDRDAFVYRLRVEASAQVSADDQGRYRLPLPGVSTESEDEVARPAEPFGGLGYVGGDRLVERAKPEQAWYVHAAADGAATVTSGPHTFEPSRDVELDLSLPPGGSVAGRLVLANGASPAGWTARASDALASIVEAPVAVDGTFVLENMHAGGWQVRVFEPGLRYYPGSMLTSRTPEPDVEVFAGRTVEYVHASGARASANLHGRLWIDGAPAGPWLVCVRTSTPQAAITSHETTLDPDGRFEVELEPGLRTSLAIFRMAGGLSLTAEPEIRAGENEWAFDLVTARLEGTLDLPEPVGWAGSGPTYESEQSGVTIRTPLSVGEDGRFGPALVPAGRGRLLGPRTDFRTPSPVLVELDLEAGETRRVEVR